MLNIVKRGGLPLPRPDLPIEGSRKGPETGNRSPIGRAGRVYREK